MEAKENAQLPKELQETFASIAHQWRQPLSYINSLVGTIDNRLYELGIDDALLTQKLFEIEKLTKEMSQSIDDYRGMLKEQEQRVFLCKLIEEIAQNVAYSLEKEEVSFVWSVDESLSFAGDTQLLKQVIVTLIDNARDALVSRNVYESEIKLSAQELQDSLVIRVCDNAGGMSKSIRSRIFDADFTTKHSSEGTGLGLYMARKLLDEKLGASLSVKNVDRGVCFEIAIPKGKNE